MPTMDNEISVQLKRLDEHRIRVLVSGAPPDAVAWANGWEAVGNGDGPFSFNCMAYSDLTVGIVVTAHGRRSGLHASVADLRMGETLRAAPDGYNPPTLD